MFKLESNEEGFLSSIANDINSALFRYRLLPERGFDFLNNAISNLTGYPLAGFLEEPDLILRIIAPADRPRFDEILSKRVDGAILLGLICRDGQIRTFDFHFVHVVNLDQEILALEGTIHKHLDLPDCPASVPLVSMDHRVEFYAQKLKMAGDIGLSLAEKLTLNDIYVLLSASIMELYPDLRMITIARYVPDVQQLVCVSALVDHETLDASQLPPVTLEPPGKGTQSEAVHTRKPVIIPDLVARHRQIKKVMLVDKNGDSSGTAPQSALCVPMLSKGEVLGVIQLQSPLLDAFTEEDAVVISIVANTAAVAIQNAALVDSLKNSRKAIQLAYDATLEALSRAMEKRDCETDGHNLRVAELALQLGKRLQLDDRHLLDLWRGAFLHDIGKIGVRDAVLRKTGPLDDEEWTEMRKHAEYGYQILSHIPFLKNSLEIPHYHHEKWDGSGYPEGLKGEEIPLSARIFSIIDAWDELLSNRPHRKAWGRDEAKEYIQDGAGTHFEPGLVKEFLKMIDL